MIEDHDDEDPLLTEVGPAWFPPPDPPPPAPKWLNGRAFPAVWRDTLPFTVGGVVAAQTEFSHMMPGAGWRLDPEPGSDADVDQAIAAKIHLGLRTLPILAEAQLVVVDPADVRAIPEWADAEQAAEYAAEAELPASPMFLDLEAVAGAPVSWEAESWPLSFHLRGALCWVRDGILSVVPYGSVACGHLPRRGDVAVGSAAGRELDEIEALFPRPSP